MKMYNLFFLFISASIYATPPVAYSGKVSVDGINFSGEANFTFSIVDRNGSVLWQNDDNNQGIRVNVLHGTYLVLLGGQGMNALPSDLFLKEELSVRVTVDLDDGQGQRVLSPDSTITAHPRARVADLSVNALSADVANSLASNFQITHDMLSDSVLAELNYSRTHYANIEEGSVQTTHLSQTILDYLKPEITQPPTSKQTEQNQPVSFSVAAEGKFLKYQWKKDGIDLEGENNSSLVIDSANYDLDAGNYSVSVSNDFGTVTTDEFELNFGDVVMLWDKTLGSSGIDRLLSAVATQDRGFLLAGTSDSNASGDKSDDSKGGYDVWVVKMDENGSKIWDKTYGGTGLDGAPDGSWENRLVITDTNDSGYLIACNSDSNISADKSENSRGGMDFWVVKIDENGTKLWDKTYGGSNDEVFLTLEKTLDGGFLLGGSSQSGISGEKSENSRGEKDVWVVKVDENGSKIWDKTYGGDNWDEVNSIKKTADSGFLLVGYSDSDSGERQSYISEFDNSWIIKIDDNGTIIWEVTPVSSFASAYSYPSEISQTHDGGFMILGDYFDQDWTNSSPYLVKLDSNGSKVFDLSLEVTWADRLGFFGRIRATSGGEFIVGGPLNADPTTNSYKSEDSRGEADFWIAKVDENGTKIWDKTLGSSQRDVLENIISLGDNSYLLSGGSASNTSGEKSDDSEGGNDFWVIKIRDLDE